MTGLLSRVEFCRLANACHRERFAGFQRDAVRLFVFADRTPLVVAVREHHAVAALEGTSEHRLFGRGLKARIDHRA